MSRTLDTLHAIEDFIGRDLSRRERSAIIAVLNEDQMYGMDTVEHYAGLIMTAQDFEWVYR